MHERELWEKCVAFHGHSCPGLLLGYKAALYATELLELSFSADEEVACVSENDACCVDAIQVILGCSAGKGNLMFHMTGKVAFSFYDRRSGKSARLVCKPRTKAASKDEEFARLWKMAPAEIYEVKPTKIALPEPAKIFGSIVCDSCGELTSENYIHLQGGKKLCPDCYTPYNRFNVF